MSKIVDLFGPAAKQNRQRLVLNVMIGACSFVAGFGMFSGFISLGQEIGLLEVIAAALFTVLVAAALTYAVHNAFGAPTRRERLGWAGLWLTCASVSVIMGFGLYFGLLSADTYSEDRIRAQSLEVIAPLSGFAQAYTQLASSAGEAAAYSKQVESQEFQFGGTCPGSTRPEEGPRRRLRNADAAVFQNYSEHFAARANAMNAALKNAEKSRGTYSPSTHEATVTSIRHAYDAARLAAADPRIADWGRMLRERTARGRAPMVDPATGGSFECPDQALEAKMAGAARVALPALPAELIDIDAPSHEQGVRRGIQIAMGKTAFDARIDALPFLLGILVDLLLLGFVRAKSLLDGPDPGSEAGESRRGGGAVLLKMRHSMSRPSMLGFLGGRLDSILRSPGWYWTGMLQRWSSRSWRHLRVAVPTDPDAHEDAPALRRVLSLLSDSPEVKFEMTLPAGDLPGRLRTVCESKLSADAYVDVYRLPVGLIAQLERDWLREQMVSPDPDGLVARPIPPRAA